MTEMHNEVYKAMPENIHAHKHTHRGEKNPKPKTQPQKFKVLDNNIRYKSTPHFSNL